MRVHEKVYCMLTISTSCFKKYFYNIYTDCGTTFSIPPKSGCITFQKGFFSFFLSSLNFLTKHNMGMVISFFTHTHTQVSQAGTNGTRKRTPPLLPGDVNARAGCRRDVGLDGLPQVAHHQLDCLARRQHITVEDRSTPPYMYR